MTKVVDKLGQPDRIRYELKQDRYGTLYLIRERDLTGRAVTQTIDGNFNNFSNSALKREMEKAITEYETTQAMLKPPMDVITELINESH